MSTYADLLKSQGASDEDVKLLDTPIARKAYDKLQSDLAGAERVRQEAQAAADANKKWYDEQALPYIETLTKAKNTAVGEAAANAAKVKALQEAGLIEAASNEEVAAEAARKAAAAGQPTFDASKYVTTETLHAVANREGDAIAIAQDIAYEHSRLFPDKPLNFRNLRKEAVEKNISVETLWETRYGVPAARDAKAAADKAAYEAKIAADAVSRFKSEHPITQPGLGYSQPSANPFTGNVPSATDSANLPTNAPWLKSDAQRVNDRISKVLTKHPDLVN